MYIQTRDMLSPSITNRIAEDAWWSSTALTDLKPQPTSLPLHAPFKTGREGDVLPQCLMLLSPHMKEVRPDAQALHYGSILKHPIMDAQFDGDK